MALAPSSVTRERRRPHQRRAVARYGLECPRAADLVRVPVTVAAVMMALSVTGTLSARLGGSPVARALVRLLVGGAAGLAITYGIGSFVGTAL